MSDDKFSVAAFTICVMLACTLAIGFIIGIIYESDALTTTLDESNNSTNVTYFQVRAYCSTPLEDYKVQSPDWSSCSDQNECDLKELRVAILEDVADRCISAFWEIR